MLFVHTQPETLNEVHDPGVDAEQTWAALDHVGVRFCVWKYDTYTSPVAGFSAIVSYVTCVNAFGVDDDGSGVVHGHESHTTHALGVAVGHFHKNAPSDLAAPSLRRA
jgi:hypothetical protein